MANESLYRRRLIRKLETIYPGCIILKNDPAHLQGVPDLLFLHHSFWAALETKFSNSSPYRPNQGFYLDTMNAMSFAASICPQNEGVVLGDLQEAYEFHIRHSRIS